MLTREEKIKVLENHLIYYQKKDLYYFTFKSIIGHISFEDFDSIIVYNDLFNHKRFSEMSEIASKIIFNLKNVGCKINLTTLDDKNFFIEIRNIKGNNP